MFTRIKQWFYKKKISRADKAYARKCKTIAKVCNACTHDWDAHEYKRICKKCGRYEILMYHKFGNIRYSWEGIDPIELP